MLIQIFMRHFLNAHLWVLNLVISVLQTKHSLPTKIKIQRNALHFSYILSKLLYPLNFQLYIVMLTEMLM